MTYSIGADLLSALPSSWNHRRLKEVADVTPSNVDKHTVEGQTAVRLCNYVDTYKNEKITLLSPAKTRLVSGVPPREFSGHMLDLPKGGADVISVRN